MVELNKLGDFNNDFKNEEFQANYKTSGCFGYSEHECNPRWPHTVVIVRENLDGNPWEEDVSEEVLYDGACRSYRRSSTTFKETVMSNVRMLSIKGFISGLRPNDRIRVDKYGYIEEGYIKDVNAYMAGRGMTIEWDYERV